MPSAPCYRPVASIPRRTRIRKDPGGLALARIALRPAGPARRCGWLAHRTRLSRPGAVLEADAVGPGVPIELRMDIPAPVLPGLVRLDLDRVLAVPGIVPNAGHLPEHLLTRTATRDPEPAAY